MARISTAVNDRRPARRWPGWLATVPIAAISSVVVAGPGEAARDAAARDAATEVYRPGGMAPDDAERALGHDLRAVAGCLLAAIAWIAGHNFLTETGARPLTGPAYGGPMSEDNARLLARFNAHIGVSAGPLRAVPVAALTP